MSSNRQDRAWALIVATIVAVSVVAGFPDLTSEGLEAFRKKDFAVAERFFVEVIQREPRNARAWKLLGMTYAAQEKYNLAAASFHRSCFLDKREENACYYLARTEFALARFREALDHYRIALDAGAGRGRVLLGMALVYEATSQPRDAEDHYRQAIDAGEKQARVDYGLFLFKQGRGRQGLALLEAAGAKAEAARVRSSLAGTVAAAVMSGPADTVKFESSPLKAIVRNGAQGEKHLVETMIAGVAVFDYDQDGWPDIYIANGAALPGLEKNEPSYSNHLFRNNQDGTFADVTQRAGVRGTGYAMGVAAADYDNDGNVDLFVTGVRGNTLYRNRGDGTFEDVTAPAGLTDSGRQWSVAAGWFDFDNDGLLDLFVVHYVVWDPATEIVCGAPADPEQKRPAYRQYCHPTEYKTTANALYRNLGGGKFRDVSRESGIGEKFGKGMGVAFGDYDGDGRLDVFVANDTMPNFLFHNEGGGRFREAALEAGVAYDDDAKAISAMGVDFGDYDNDGREDLFVTALSNETFPLFRNLGGGHFADVTYPSGIGNSSLPWTGWSTGLFDFNNDGWKDLFVAGGHVMDNAEMSSNRKSRQPNIVYVNQGAGRFEQQLLPGEALHRGAAFGDFDHDGRIDAVVTRLNEAPLILRNRSAGGNWLELRLNGHSSNRDGIGAVVHIASPSGEQWSRVMTSTGYGCSSDRIVHFGLGKDERVNLIEIRWPSGRIQKLANVAVNQFETIEEPAP